MEELLYLLMEGK